MNEQPHRVRSRPRGSSGLLVLAVAVALAAPAGAATAKAKPASPADPAPLRYPKWETVRPGEHPGYNERTSLALRGKDVYEKYCIGCHGAAGDGNGPAAKRLITKPRNFKSGIFKFRSTDSSSLPLESDLYRTIVRGLPRASMPGFPLLPEMEKVAVIEYVKSFYARWDRRAPDRVVVPVPKAPGDLGSAARIKRGRIVFVTMQCGSCHGNDGRGGSEVFKDAWGNPQKAFDFTAGRLKGGDDPEDVYRTFHAGLVSVMPAFGPESLAGVDGESFEAQKARLGEGEHEALRASLADFPATTAEQRALPADRLAELGERNSWDLVAYVLSLNRPSSTAEAVLGGAR